MRRDGAVRLHTLFMSEYELDLLLLMNDLAFYARACFNPMIYHNLGMYMYL